MSKAEDRLDIKGPYLTVAAIQSPGMMLIHENVGAGCAILWLLKDWGHSLLVTNVKEDGRRAAA
ncbi:MAG: hypothetical protein V1897_03035 [Pseudomonadota bacterium]